MNERAGKFLYGSFFAVVLPALVLNLQSSDFADVAKVRRNGRHAPPSPGDFHHDLRGAPNDGGLDALANGVGTLVHARGAQPGLGLHLDDAVAWIEQAVAPGDEDAVERGVVRHVGSVRMTLDWRSRRRAPLARWRFHGWLLRLPGRVRPLGSEVAGRRGCRSASAMEARSRCWCTSCAR